MSAALRRVPWSDSLLLPLLVTASLAAPSPPVDAVVLVVEGGSTCAGAFVDASGTIVTAYHCVAPGGRPLVRTRDDRRAVGKVVAVDPVEDVAVIVAPELASDAWLPVRSDDPSPGDEVWVIGHPFGSQEPGGFLTGTLRWAVSTGVVAAVGTRAIEVTAPINPGNSGGPVVDADGRLIGVVSRRLGGYGVGFAARGEAVADLLAHRNGFGPLGGTLSVGVFAQSWEGHAGTLSYGGLLEASFRDRAFLSVAAAFPAHPEWDAARWGEVSWDGGEARAGLRARFLRGAMTTRVDVYGGVVVVGGRTSTGELLSVPVDPAEHLLVGGAIGLASVVVDVGFAKDGDVWDGRLQFVVRWPGEVWIF